MLADVGAPPRTPAEVHSYVGKGMAVLVERCLTHEHPPAAEQLHAAIESFKHHYLAVNGQLTQIYPGVIEGLQAWKASGIKMGVVTNKPGMFTESLLARVGIIDYFDVIVSGDTTPHKKPHPEPILHACHIFNVRPDRNLHIGDSRHDIHAAHAAGCLAFAVPYGYNEGEAVDSAECDALVSDLLGAYHQALTFKNLKHQ
jgi:phosphoglycolate phosphatase